MSTVANWLVAIFGLLALAFGNREDTLDGQKDDARDATISENVLQTAEARRDAAKSNEIAAATHERAAKLEKEAAEAKLELASAKLQIQAAERRAADVEILAKRTKADTSARSLTEEQKHILHTVFVNSPQGKVKMSVSRSDPEALRYALQIAEALTKGGHQVEMDNALHVFDDLPNNRGMVLCIKDAERPPLHASAIQKAFAKAVVPSDAIAQSGRPPDELFIKVGSLPIPQ